jgi:MFS superfamily sulfate permease-like transporter
MDSTREVSSRFTPICRLLVRFLPALNWLGRYERRFLPGDALAGVIVATLLIPQAMAYALLAGFRANASKV